MAGRFGTVALAVFVLSVSAVAARRAILSEASGAQYDLGDIEGMHRHLMTSLKAAQEQAGIFVDDAYLFEQPLTGQGRKLQQATESTAAALSNPSVLATLLSLVGQGMTVGTFPGASMNLPGGSSLGYSPTENSYCLFATQPYSGPPAPPAAAVPGPLAAAGIPETFGCVAASANIPTSPNSFPITVGGQAFVCQGAAPPTGRRLQQAPSPTDAAIGNALAAIGLPIWNCVVATTPAGNTTLGEASLAVLNDLGVVAEHLLVYLNGNGQLTYEQNVKNGFVSLTNPLYPTGPRLNFSIDFSVVDKDSALVEEIFGKPATPASPAAAPGTPSNPTTVPPSPAGYAASPGSASGAAASPGAAASTGSSSGSTPNSPPSTATTTVTAFDGYLDNCQVVIGSVPQSDGNFNRNNNFTATVDGGQLSMTMDNTNSFAGQVLYVIPASKAAQPYPALTPANSSQASFCNDIATLEPVYNPLASLISSNAANISANPLTTVASFGAPLGLSPSALLTAFALQVPDGETLWSYNALADAAENSTTGMSMLKSNIQVANLVTSGATMLTKNNSVYAAFAIIMNQAIAQKILYSPPGAGRRLLQAPAVDLTNATTVADIMSIALNMVSSQSVPSTVEGLNDALTPDEINAAAQATANLNAAVASSTDPDAAEKGRYYAETTLASQVDGLAQNTTSVSDFNTATSTSAISSALGNVTLPGTVQPQSAMSPPPPSPTPASTVVPQTQSSSGKSTNTQSSHSGLSHGGKVALATVLPIVGVAAIVAIAAFLVTRRNRGTYEETNNSAVWWRRPIGRSGQAPGPSTV